MRFEIDTGDENISGLGSGGKHIAVIDLGLYTQFFKNGFWQTRLLPQPLPHTIKILSIFGITSFLLYFGITYWDPAVLSNKILQIYTRTPTDFAINYK